MMYRMRLVIMVIAIAWFRLEYGDISTPTEAMLSAGLIWAGLHDAYEVKLAKRATRRY